MPTYYFQFSSGVAFWAAAGTFYLIIMSFKDVFNKMRIDDRFNFLMMGISIMLLTHFSVSVWYLLGMVLVLMLLNWYLSKFNVLGGADISAFMWLFYGYAIIGYQPLILFVVTLIGLSVLYYVIRAIMRIPEKVPTPYFPVILATFIITNLAWKLY